MGKVEIPYYVVKKGKYGYWQPTKAMRDAGFAAVRCGLDGAAAWAIAAQWNERWQRHRAGKAQDAPPEFPKGSIGEGFLRYRLTVEWTAKKPRTREEWERGWARIKPVFGDLAPTDPDISLETLSRFRQWIVENVSAREGHRIIKIWRALWNVLSAMQYCAGKQDPSLGIRNRAPKARQASWREGEAVRQIKQAWRKGYRGLAVSIAIAWDTQFSPVDLRQLTIASLKGTGTDRYFDIGRAKSGRDALGTMSRRTLQLLDAYLEVEPCDVGAILRNRSGAVYSRFTMPDDFRTVCEMLFPGDRRTLADMRRSGAIEAVTGGAEPGTVSAKMANTIDTSNALHATYQPVNLASVRAADAARRLGRKRIRENEKG
ncbi:hypothetical protein LB519_14915 [Mesorhizobium sp. AD1-1]|uniref:hypothetical protein n=1 Tax=Mesorhizobium sp. AD1-1 TaxID=2876621 RepID=UPI001CC99271|nr:hypothetical protein [Mesorhizobium sp. AD1-1]MBZ9719138.1 hypothetical protein [Mesorhizobium sp. AD1-1]